MANSSFFKNTGTSTQIQGSASASAAAALASEQAALASENAAQTSETNSAASAAASLVSKNAAATSAASANSDALASAASAVTSQTAATSSSANAASTSADAVQTAADRVQTGLDRVATNSDAVQTAADRVQTGLDVTSSSASAAAALSSRNAAATSETNAAASAASSSADATATAADRVQTGLDRAATNADAIATAADRVQTGLDATASANSASAASTSATAAAASQVSAAASAASAAAVFNDFEDRYYGPHASDSAAQTHVTGLGLTVDQGDLYFNSTANEMRVYDGGSWIAASSAGGASLINYNFTATASQTAFSGSDDNSNTLSYTVDNLIVTRNGVVLEDGTDYTATNGTSIVLTVAAAAGDEINIVAFKSFTTADMVSATSGGTFQSNVTVNGTMTATAFSGDGSALTNLPVSTPTLTSLGIPNHDQLTVDGLGNVTVTGTIEGRNVATDGTKLDGIEASADVTDDTNVRAAGAVMTTGVSTLADSAYFKGAPTHGFRFNNNTDAFNNFIIRENGDTYTRGNAGVGTSSPSNILHVSGTSGNPVLLERTNGAVCTLAFKGNTTTNNPYLGANGDDLYFNTGAGNRMTIDSSGRVTMPYQPMVSATRTTTFGTLGGNTVLMPYNSATVNVGNHYNTSTGLFTCPVSGKYRVTAYGMNAGASGDGVFYYNALLVEVAGSTQQGTPYNYGDGYVHMSGSWIVSAIANDSIGIRTSSCLGGYGGMTIELIG
jgi:hypothetical protein